VPQADRHTTQTELLRVARMITFLSVASGSAYDDLVGVTTA